MKIDLKQLKLDLSDLEGIGSSKDINIEVVFPELKFQKRNIKVPKPLELDINILNSDQAYFLTGQLKGTILLECSRCLDEFNYTIDLEIEKEIKKGDITDIKNVDISQILKSNIFLALPIKPLCSENCQGLCPQCGQNLNKGEYDCDREIVDPRLAKLQNFFADED